MKSLEDLFPRWQNRHGLSPERLDQLHRDIREMLEASKHTNAALTQPYRVLKSYIAKLDREQDDA